MVKTVSYILIELRRHAPFTAAGSLSGLVIMAVLVMGGYLNDVVSVAPSIFFILHPTHVLLSALVTTGLYRVHSSRGSVFITFIIGYVGSVGIATVSDCLIPYLSEIILALPNRELHIGFIEKPWLTNLAALFGVTFAYIRPATKFPHAGHVLISTWASLFHVLMALGYELNIIMIVSISLFLFIAVWVPCCISDIVFPMLFVSETGDVREKRILSKNHIS